MLRIKTIKHQSGMALLEVLLAIIAMSFGLASTYYIYNYVTTQQKNSRTSNQIISMASIYSDLYNANLSSTIKTENDLINSFYASNRLPKNRFIVSNGSVSAMTSPYGKLSFTDISATTFTANVPVSENSDGAKNQICNAVNDYVKSCTNNNDASVTVSIDLGDY